MGLRTYSDPSSQACYDHYFEHGDQYIRNVRHKFTGLPNTPRGDGWSVAYWKGLHGLTLPGGRIPYVRGSMGWACYMAGKDRASQESK